MATEGGGRIGHRDSGQVGEDTPELTTILEADLDGRDLTVGVEYIGGDGLEVVEENQVHFGVSEVRGHVDDDGTAVGGDEVVLLGVAMEESRFRFWAADRGQPVDEPLNAGGQIQGKMARVDGRPEVGKNPPLGKEVDPAVRTDGSVVLAQGTVETVQTVKSEPCPVDLVDSGQGGTDRSPVLSGPIGGGPFGKRLDQEEDALIENDESSPDRGRGGDGGLFPQEQQALQFGAELLGPVFAYVEFGEDREGFAVEDTAGV